MRGSNTRAPSQHLHAGLIPEHPLLIGGQDQGLLAGQVVRLGANVPFSIEEKHPQQLTCRIEQMYRDDANRALLLHRAADSGKGERVSAGHGCAGERPCSCAPSGGPVHQREPLDPAELTDPCALGIEHRHQPPQGL